jgi:hypothetical protein
MSLCMSLPPDLLEHLVNRGMYTLLHSTQMSSLTFDRDHSMARSETE